MPYTESMVCIFNKLGNRYSTLLMRAESHRIIIKCPTCIIPTVDKFLLYFIHGALQPYVNAFLLR